MNFCWITLNVSNMEKSLKFYHEVIGLEIFEKFNAGEDLEIVMLGEKDGTKLELIHNKKLNIPAKAERLSIGFQVKSLDEAMELLKNNNISIKRGPISPKPGTIFLFVEDPDGIEVQIVEHN
ncbi:lactoylglutathione lyase [Clostridium saccharoperbutylacetonicum]|uniref:Glyoxalase family protein n=1 Tax=Clostridium saccharoperbutylacetonicum N1-4(HMT) TaxID=931276 RepID=M1MVL9_9CLOT|nr:VOC family protein [Clostridium saccharoperbutylacetonicum]AGF55562.1 glyoxalase family protein [Clostridium saccharoperbutylacetonicum N1-4(HMT)]NRT63717.1 lactoylglutathione lyase [Clostridium saccharoperbutylacetonicum]NSB27080.1 lactoylglutathione lyase [Clostridium saccharoperbutylacetonicum]NSB40565.1 lactoylglutathione lyase [Clostridium saccharoperbutylacetonicum]